MINPHDIRQRNEKRQVFKDFAKAVDQCSFILKDNPELIFQQTYNLLRWKGGDQQTLKNRLNQERARFKRPWLRLLSKPYWSTSTIIRRCTGHKFGIQDCAFSPDGKKIVSAGHDKTLKIWDAESGLELNTLAGHGNRVVACCFSPDGQSILSASWDNNLKLWNAADGKEKATLQGHAKWALSCAFSPDSNFILSGSSDKTLRLWDASSGKEIRIMRSYEDWVLKCLWSPDGKSILCAIRGDHRIRFLAASSGEDWRSFQVADRGDISAVAWSPDGRFLALGNTLDRNLKVWDMNAEKEIASFPCPHPVGACSYDPEGKYIVSGSGRGLMLWDAEKLGLVSTFEGHGGDVTACVFGPHSRTIASAAMDGSLALWNAESMKERDKIEEETSIGLDFAFGPGKKRILYRSGGQIQIVEAETSACLVAVKTSSLSAFSPDGSKFLLIDEDKTLKIIDTDSGAEIAAIKGYIGVLDGCVFTPDGRRIAGQCGWGKLGVWDVQTGEKFVTMTGHANWVHYHAFSLDGSRLVSWSRDDNKVKLWDSGSGKEIASHSGLFVSRGGLLGALSQIEANGLPFSPDGRMVAFTTQNGMLKIIDAKNGDEIFSLKIHYSPVEICAFSADGQFILAVGEYKHALKMWNIKTGREESTMFDSNARDVRMISVEPGRKRLLTAHWKGIVKVLDMRTGRDLLSVEHKGKTELKDCTFSPDGRHILTLGDDLRLWDANSGANIATFRSYVGALVSCKFSPEGGCIIAAVRERGKILLAQENIVFSSAQ